jgi:hypothetical protein
LYKKDKSPSNFNECKCYRNKVKQLIRNAKKKYYAQRLKKKLPSKDMWNNVRDLGILNNKKEVILEGCTPNDFNQHFPNSSLMLTRKLFPKLLTLFLVSLYRRSIWINLHLKT